MNIENINKLIDQKFLLETQKNEIKIHKKNNIYREDYINNITNLINIINEILIDNCEHIWITDYIDGPFSSREICYCSKCFIYK
tara:strand:- start:1823 stop:2074 length:252 start_codon:yes stop_codon:yes gene_type:complete